MNLEIFWIKLMRKVFKWLTILVILGGFLIITAVIFISTHDLNYLKPTIEKAAMDATGRTLSIQGDIHFYLGLSPGICLNNVTFENARWSGTPHMLKVKLLRIHMQLLPLLTHRFHIKQLTLKDLDISIEINKRGQSNLPFENSPHNQSKPATNPTVSFPQIGFQNICLKNIHLDYSNEMTSRQLSMTINEVIARGKGLNQPVSMTIVGNYQKHPFDIQAQVGSINRMLDSKQEWPLAITAQCAGMALSANGVIQDVLTLKGLDVQFRGKGKKFKEFQNFIGTTWPLNGPYRFQMALSEKSASQYGAQVELSLGNNKLKGLGELHLDRPRPGLKLVFEADTIDLRPFITKGKPLAKQSAIKNGMLFSNNTLISKPLVSIDFIGIFRIQTLITPRIAIHDIDTKINLTPDSFQLKPFRAKIGGGDVAGEFNLTCDRNVNITTKLITKNMNMRQMLQELDIADTFEGVTDFRLYLKTQGRSLHQWMSQLNGYVSAQMDSGKIYNQYVNMLGGELSSNIIRLINPLKKNQYSHIHCLVVRFDITHGLADTTIMMMDTDQMRVVADGHISLDTETIDISIKPLPKRGLDTGRLGQYSLSLSELAQPFKLGGTLTRPRLKMDITKAAWTIGKTVGGVMLFGPVGIAAGLISGVADNNHPCKIAKHVARTGKYPKEVLSDKSFMQKTQESVQEGINRLNKGIGDTFKTILGQ